MGRYQGGTKFHLVSWEKICTPILCGGLGVWKLRTFKKALLGKWLWWYHQESESLWRVVIDANMGVLGRLVL